MFLQNFLRDYLRFSRRDRTGVLALTLLILIIYFLPILFPSPTALSPQTELALTAAADTLLARPPAPDYPSSYPSGESPPAAFTPGRLFRFDPNTLAAEGWKRLGLGDRATRTILNYRSKGGRFHAPADLQKIWGLPPAFYAFVKDSIDLPGLPPKQGGYTPAPFEKRERKIGAIGINSGDTADFIALPGIGSRLAARIVAFRERLGGFYSVDQVGETYGLPDSTFQKIRPYLLPGGAVRRINVNTATREELKEHPYIRWKLAGAIVGYRERHGPFKSLDELAAIGALDEATLKKLLPYLAL